MADPVPPPSAIMESVNDALQGLEAQNLTKPRRFWGSPTENSHTFTRPKIRISSSAAIATHISDGSVSSRTKLDKRLATYPFLLADLPELDIDRLPVFRIRFTLLATHVDAIVAVYEQDAGGEITELGKISTTPYFKKSYVLPRDYAWMTEQNLDTEADVMAAAATIYFNDDLDDGTTEEELDSLITAATKNDINLTTPDVIDRLADREDSERAPVSYSWVHLNEFRVFELHDRCFAWSNQDDLRDVVDEVP